MPQMTVMAMFKGATNMKRLIVILLLILLALYFCCGVVVTQGTYALKFSTLSQTKTPTLLNPGLHFRIPLLDSIETGSTQPIQLPALQANGATETPYLSAQTFDKHNIALGYSVLLQINDPAAFYQKTHPGNLVKDLRNQLNQALSNKIAGQTLMQLLQASTQQNTSNAIIATLNQTIQPSGIKILALYFTSINIANFERPVWIDHMKTQQESQLAQLQQQTTLLSQSLRAETDNKITAILAQGIDQANKIRTNGALYANKIYLDAYDKDPAFYEFFQNLQMYKQILTSKQDVLILSTHTPFFSTLASTGAPSKNTARNSNS